MIISLNEIRTRALEFSREYATADSEQMDAHNFWRDFFEVFGINARRVGSFEQPVRNLFTGAGRGRIDYLWKGTVLVEHKSRGEDLDRAAGQARDYFPGLKDNARYQAAAAPLDTTPTRRTPRRRGAPKTP